VLEVRDNEALTWEGRRPVALSPITGRHVDVGGLHDMTATVTASVYADGTCSYMSYGPPVRMEHRLVPIAFNSSAMEEEPVCPYCEGRRPEKNNVHKCVSCGGPMES